MMPFRGFIFFQGLPLLKKDNGLFSLHSVFTETWFRRGLFFSSKPYSHIRQIARMLRIISQRYFQLLVLILCIYGGRFEILLESGRILQEYTIITSTNEHVCIWISSIIWKLRRLKNNAFRNSRCQNIRRVCLYQQDPWAFFIILMIL